MVKTHPERSLGQTVRKSSGLHGENHPRGLILSQSSKTLYRAVLATKSTVFPVRYGQNTVSNNTARHYMSNNYQFLDTSVIDYEQVEYGFSVRLEAEYATGSGGAGYAQAFFNHIEDNVWDVPELKIAFDDSSDDYDGLIECTKEFVTWMKENRATIDIYKQLYVKSLG
jgi:hypothetical protein